jgi:uncharacterized sulfatase
MTVDRIRSVRDKRYKFIRNFMPERPYTQHNDYIKQQYPTLTVMQKLYAEGKLNPVQSLFMAPLKPEIEFYDTQADPHEVNNLAHAPEQQLRIQSFQKKLDGWLNMFKDYGADPEPESAQTL